ncbi:MAG: YkgJ family cysteine cluster protein [Cyanobacteria bacterium]|nr:YkgJ family cysteine cluster protein [Cyanobacteriota bacterium]
MRDIIHSFLSKTDAAQSRPIRGKYYVRTGACNQCGKCCKDIYLIHGNETIDTLELFEALKPENPEYRHFKPVESTENGLQFQCMHLSPTNQCTIYQNRPDFCRKYPSEKTILLGGALAKGCGYKFELLQTFDQVLQKVSTQKNIKAGKLLDGNDVDPVEAEMESPEDSLEMEILAIENPEIPPQLESASKCINEEAFEPETSGREGKVL